ncbi:uncharacterized protein N7484_010738 [Penicillium longicatenatum]|uniref:uncharacterized protein n=1 Tax=Penicillium longicatenatum TaxID=1561947 RepID=UPI0025496903|nr:uncharacterized protein N7484_010738 [Penicillium longicatenatum]KAJ5630638.1 hypothetical protein N7484_010738 [Penicillium longicatenatum]
MASVTCGIHMGGAPAEMAVAHLNLDLISKLPSELAITEITERCSTVDLSEPSSPEMDIPRVKRIDPPRSRASIPDSPTHASRFRAVSGSQSTSATNSIHHSRSASRSTGRSRPPSRHSSFHSPRRPVTNAGIVSVPARVPQQEKRESLLALHRESCRLFQDPPSSVWVPEEMRKGPTASPSRHERRTSSEAGTSGPPSPIASSSSSRRFEYDHRGSISSTTSPPFLHSRDRANTLPIISSHSHSPSESSINVPATVMEWTSDSTRRAEYEQIDRASRGVRGLWRRVAPRWCHRDSRMPFFEEGKTSREGSVRRFRMDLPDEETETNTRDKPQAQILDFLNKKPSRDGHGRRLWTGRRSKTSLT